MPAKKEIMHRKLRSGGRNQPDFRRAGNPSQVFSSRGCLLKCRRFICYIGKPGLADACVCLPNLEIRSWPPGKIPSQMAG